MFWIVVKDKNHKYLRFLDRDGSWTQDINGALPFTNRREAVKAANKLHGSVLERQA